MLLIKGPGKDPFIYNLWNYLVRSCS